MMASWAPQTGRHQSIDSSVFIHTSSNQFTGVRRHYFKIRWKNNYYWRKKYDFWAKHKTAEAYTNAREYVYEGNAK